MSESKGTWLDTKTNKIVTSQPEEGLQLIAPGVEATDADKARVEAVKASLAGPVEPKTITTVAADDGPATVVTPKAAAK